MAGSFSHTPQMRAIASPFLFFCQAHHSRPVIGSMATATWMYLRELHGLEDRHPARRPDLAHLADQPHAHLVSPHDPLAQPQADCLQPGPEPPFFQAVWAWGAALGWRGRGVLSRIPSRGSKVYMLPTV